MFVIAGLGNPGEEYKNTRHNIGRMVAEAFIKKNAFPAAVPSKKFAGLFSEGVMSAADLKKPSKKNKEKVVVIMPETFMNKSGSSVKTLVTSEKKAEQLIVVHDDLDLALGTFKISFNRGSGGHRGVESIIKNLKTEAFVRLKIGISPTTPGGKLKKPLGDKVLDFIIGDFKLVEAEEIKKVSKKAADALKMIIEEGRAAAMNEMNQG